MRKKREYLSSELVQSFVRYHKLEDKVQILKIRAFLRDYLDDSFYAEISSVALVDGVLSMRIGSPLLKNDLRRRKTQLLDKIATQTDVAEITDLVIL